MKLGEGRTDRKKQYILQEQEMSGISMLLFLDWKSPATSKMEKRRISKPSRNGEVSVAFHIFKSGDRKSGVESVHLPSQALGDYLLNSASHNYKNRKEKKGEERPVIREKPLRSGENCWPWFRTNKRSHLE